MSIANPRLYLLLAAVVVIGACGRAERNEAAQFARAMAEKKAVFDSANANEKDLVKNARAWSTGITTNGAGRGDQLDKNAAMAAELAKSAVAISAQLSQVRQVIDAQSLNEEFPRGVRNELREKLTRRQRTLQETRAMLEEAAPQFLGYKQDKSYQGDAYPETIAKLITTLNAQGAPEDALGAAIQAIQTKYDLSDAELPSAADATKPPKS